MLWWFESIMRKRQWSIFGSAIISVGALPFVFYFVIAVVGPLVEYGFKSIGFQGVLLTLFTIVVAVLTSFVCSAIISFSIYVFCRWTNVSEVGNCPHCRCDLAGNVLPICPECGVKI